MPHRALTLAVVLSIAASVGCKTIRTRHASKTSATPEVTQRPANPGNESEVSQASFEQVASSPPEDPWAKGTYQFGNALPTRSSGFGGFNSPVAKRC